MKKIEKVLFVIIALNALMGIYYVYCGGEIFGILINGVLHGDFHYVGSFVELMISNILTLLLIIGLIICVNNGKPKMNNWIKIPVIYYTLIFVFVGLPNYLVPLFKPSLESFSFTDLIIYYLNFALNTSMIVLSIIYWNKKHIAELLVANINVSYNRIFRLKNYFIDSFVIGVIVFMVTKQLKYNNMQIDYFYIYLIFKFIYYFFCELVFRQTIGKVITNSVVHLNSDNPFKGIFIRSISRYIPFEPFSFIGKNSEGWHDKLSKTTVVGTSDVKMMSQNKMNYVAIIILLIIVLYMLLIFSDSPMSRKIPEQLILWLPVFFLIPLGASVISLRIKKNIIAIVTTVISIILLLLTLLLTLFLMNFSYRI